MCIPGDILKRRENRCQIATCLLNSCALVQRHPQNLLWLSFEDLKKDLAGGVNVVAKHINVQLDEAIRSNVVHASSFNAMKKQFNDMDAIDVRTLFSMVVPTYKFVQMNRPRKEKK